MADSAEREKVIECIFDPDVSSILAELEDGAKDAAYLSDKLGIDPGEIRDRLSYLLECGYVAESGSVYSADAEKLAKVMEHDENFQSAIDGMTKLDGFLN